MRTSPFFACAAALAALSACAGGGGTATSSALPAAASRATAGTSVAYNDSEIYVADTDALRSYPANVNGAAPAPDRTWAYPAGTTPIDVVEAPDLTVYVLVKNASGTASVVAYAPKTTKIEEEFDLPAGSSPFAIALVGDGIDVATPTTVYTYPYGAGNNASPTRTLTFTNLTAGTFAVDTDDRLYVGTAFAPTTTIDEYAAAASGAAAPIASYSVSAPVQALVVAENETIYVSTGDALGDESTVETVPRNGGTPRVVAQFTDGTGGELVQALGVDKDGYLYLGMNTDGNLVSLGVAQQNAQLDVFGSNAAVSSSGANPATSRSATGIAPSGVKLVNLAVGNG